MLEFPQDFFEEEIREGFTVSSTMKRFWAAELEVLREIAEVCERHNLQWYAAYGTLLGVIRHEGYVPWDDDIDIWMEREDYNKFMEVAPKELPEEFVVKSSMTEVGYKEFHACVFNALNVSIGEERLRRFHGCPFEAAVDIFPLDYLPRNEVEHQAQASICYLIGIVASLIKKEERTEEDEEELQSAFDTIEDVCKVSFQRDLLGTERNDELVSSVYKLLNQLCMCYGKEDGDYMVMYMDYLLYPHKVYDKKWFEKIEMKPFEGFLIPVPAGYDDILKTIYGDYHIRIQAPSQHEYPLYKKQLEAMREKVEELEAWSARIDEMIAEARQKSIEQQQAQAQTDM